MTCIAQAIEFDDKDQKRACFNTKPGRLLCCLSRNACGQGGDMTGADMVIEALRIWAMIGAGVAAVFLTFGMDRIDEDAQGAYVFRPLLIPGVLAIWPLVLWRWYLWESSAEPWERRFAPPRAAHLFVGWLMPLVICAIILTGLSVRQIWPADIAPVQIDPAAEVDG